MVTSPRPGSQVTRIGCARDQIERPAPQHGTGPVETVGPVRSGKDKAFRGKVNIYGLGASKPHLTTVFSSFLGLLLGMSSNTR